MTLPPPGWVDLRTHTFDAHPGCMRNFPETTKNVADIAVCVSDFVVHKVTACPEASKLLQVQSPGRPIWTASYHYIAANRLFR